ncbi:hypothetical protein GCM10027592_00540 [Spirosoma flavus]
MRLRSYITSCLFLCISTVLQAQDQRIAVETDLGIELVNALEVQNSPEFLKDSLADPHMYQITRLMRISYTHFAPFRQHKAVQRTHWMTDKLGTGVYLLPLFYDRFPTPHRHTPVSPEILQAVHPNADSAQSIIDEYMQLVGQFYHDADFAGFQKQYHDVYARALSQVKRNLPPPGFIPQMEAYYGAHNYAYRIIVNPFFKAEWGMAWQVPGRKGPIANQIAAPLQAQIIQENTVKNVGFDNPEAVRNLSVHEFGHTFVNPLTARPAFAQKIATYKYLFKPIQGQPQYSDWETSFNEHLVRAGEVRIALALGLPNVAQQIRNNNANWMYLPFFESQLKRYESNRKRYPTLESFLPELIASLSTLPR